MLDRNETPARMRSLSFTAARRVHRTPQLENALPESPEPYATAGDGGIAQMQAMQEVLRAAAPHALPFGALLNAIRERPDSRQLETPGDIAPDAVMLASLQAGVIEPHVIAPRLACPPGERPAASAVVRAQLAAGDMVTSLWHQLVKIDDDVASRLLPLLDGTRDRSALRITMAGWPVPMPPVPPSSTGTSFASPGWVCSFPKAYAGARSAAASSRA